MATKAKAPPAPARSRTASRKSRPSAAPCLPTGVVEYLFRYRDLVAKTLAAHRAVIKQHDACWWGWWKRPSEPAHEEVWAAIQNALSDGGQICVGLYNSGDGKVYRAWINGIVPPTVDEATGECVEVVVPDGEQDLIPKYYRRSPFSRAWLRITKIEDQTLDFFGRYSFQESPPLPLYPAAVLERLKGKVVLDKDELNAMDTTIWRVRMREQQDRDERVLMLPSAVIAPVSSSPIRVSGDTILHITDPHFALGMHRSKHVWRMPSETENARSTLAEAVAAAVRTSGHKIAVIVVTGDLTFKGDDEEFAEAARSITELLGRFDLWHEHLVVIPGNHDIRWTNASTYTDDAEVNVAPAEARKGYEKFFRSLFRYSANRHLSMGRRYVFPHGGSVEFCAVNSSSLEQGKKFLAGMGRVQEAAFTEVATELGWNSARTLALRILALHHHLVPTEDLEMHAEYLKGFGMAIDAARIQRRAAADGVQLALHGHKHRLFLWRSDVYELPERTQPKWSRGTLSIIGGGSAGSDAVEANMNFFNLIHVASDALTLQTYRTHGAGSFGRTQTLKSPLMIEQGALRLGPWTPVPE